MPFQRRQPLVSSKAATGSKTANAGRFHIGINYLTNQAQEQLCTNLVIRSLQQTDAWELFVGSFQTFKEKPSLGGAARAFCLAV